MSLKLERLMEMFYLNTVVTLFLGRTRMVLLNAASLARTLLRAVTVLQVLVCVLGKRVSLGKHQQFILDQHNDYRRQEKASNMCLMKWNTTLEAAAARWAERCEFKHERTSGHGENLAFDSRNFETEKLLDGLMTGWHNEKRMWTYGSNSCGFACHFTQLVWHSTNAVGCAAVRCPHLKGMMGSIKNAFYLVCFYNPKGNWIGKVPYIPGRACSKCDDGSTCNKDLCDNVGGSGSKKQSASGALSLKQNSNSKGHFSITRQSSRFQTFSHGTGANRKTISRGTSSFHRSGPIPIKQGLLNSPLALKAGKFISLSDQGTAAGAPRPFTLQKQSAGVDLRESGEAKRRWRKCRDRLPSCWKWAGRCGSSRAMKVMCPKSCDSCEDQYSMVNGGQHSSREVINKTTDRRTLRSGTVGHRRGLRPDRPRRNHARRVRRPKHPRRQRQRQNKHQQHSVQQKLVQRTRNHHQTSVFQNGGQSRRQFHTRRNTQQSRAERYQRRRQHQHRRQGSSRERIQGQRPQLKHKQATQHERKQENQVLAQKDNPFCEDSRRFASRCGYWAKTGFCKQNYMMRDLYCKKSCGNC